MIDNRESPRTGFSFAPLVNLRDGKHLSYTDSRYLVPASPEQVECEHFCSAHPHYACTRRKAHKGDHAAHGANDGTPVMFARWRRE